MKLAKVNEVAISGNVSNVDVKQGQNGLFGSISVAVDDGYKDNNGQGKWVDRTHFIEVKVSDKFLKSIKGVIAKGDFIELEGKLVIEKWKDKTTQQDRSAMKVQGFRITSWVPKVAKEALKNAGLMGSQQHAPQQHAPQQHAPQQHAPQQHAPQQHAPQQHAPQQHAPQPQQGGFDQQSAYDYGN